MTNAFSIDVEDWFCVHNFSQVISFDQWDSCELRVEKNTLRLCALLDEFGIKATFFILGWIADKCPSLVKLIKKSGHEIATHGYAHLTLTNATPDEFEQDLVKSLVALARCGVNTVKGYRAPSFSISRAKPWIFEILKKHGILYDSSFYPVALHPDYANASIPLFIHKTEHGIIEFPMSCFSIGAIHMPCSGGGYLRLLPLRYSLYGIRRCNRQGRPVVFYIHPWEIDPDQPRVRSVSLAKYFRHYIHLGKTEQRLRQLFLTFQFSTIESVLRENAWMPSD